MPRYTIDDARKWAEKYKECKSMAMVGKCFPETNIKTIVKYLKTYVNDLGIMFEHEERKSLKSNGLKRCGRCKKIKKIEEFETILEQSRRSECIVCRKIYNKEYAIEHNQDIKKYNKKYREVNKEFLHERDVKRYQIHKDEWSKVARETYRKNWTEIRARRKERHKERMKTDPLYCLRHSLRARMNVVFKNKTGVSSILEYIGCTIEELKIYLEKQFYVHSKTGEMMTWKNKGFCGWHIDHIIPLSSASNEEETIKLFHYTNLRPLWAEENWSKGAKIIDMESK